jgi:hypothetical protein
MYKASCSARKVSYKVTSQNTSVPGSLFAKICGDHPTIVSNYTKYQWRRFSRLEYIPIKGLMHDPLLGDDLWWFKVGPSLDASGIWQSFAKR